MSDRSDKRADRLQLMLTHEEIELIDNWRFKHRMPSRSAAVRALLRLAFKNDEANDFKNMMQGVTSGDVGIVSSNWRVDRSIGIGGYRKSVAVAGNDNVIALAVKCLLRELGVPLSGFIETAEDMEVFAGNKRPKVIIVVAAPPYDEIAPLVEAVAALNCPTLVVAPDGDSNALPQALKSARIISHRDLPDRLGETVCAMLSPKRGKEPLGSGDASQV